GLGAAVKKREDTHKMAESNRAFVPRSVSDTRLPAVVGEGPVRFGHLVRVLTLLDSRPETVAGVDQLVHQTLGHALLSAPTRESDQPAQGQRGGPGGTNLDRHLV